MANSPLRQPQADQPRAAAMWVRIGKSAGPEGRQRVGHGVSRISVNLRCEDILSRGAAAESSPWREPWDRVRR